MSALDFQYYKNNRILLSVVGAWPYQSKASIILAFIIFLSMGCSHLYFQLYFMMSAGSDMAILVESGTSVAVKLVGVTRVINNILKRNKMKILIDEMARNNGCSLNPNETSIMRTYTETGQKITLFWTAYVYAAVFIVTCLPILPTILGTVGNETKQLPHPIKTPAAIESYFYPLLIHQVASSIVLLTALASSDTLFITSIQHACGMFAVLGDKIRNAVEEDEDERMETNMKKSDDVTYRNFIGCIDHHTKAIKFAELIENTHNKVFLISVLLNMLVVSFTGIEMVMISSETDKRTILRQITTLGGLMTHLFIENFFGQRLYDHSIDGYNDILYSNWYRASLKTKKLLNLFIIKSIVPCVVTIGGRFVFCMENFTEVLRLSASYFTIFRSMQ